jgi:polyphosphate kinase
MKKLIEKTHFINRELSWLDFNSRVLDQAFDRSNPLLERLKFMAIFSNNLDEFFMVRVAGVRQHFEAEDTKKDPAGLTPAEQLTLIHARIRLFVRRQYNYFQNTILKELKSAGIYLLKPESLSIEEKERLKHFFKKDVLPVLTPIGVDPTHPFPVINNKMIEILVNLKKPNKKSEHYGFVEVPAVLPRFVKVNYCNAEKAFILLEDLILEHIEMLFAGCSVLSAFPFRITKDMDFTIEDEEATDFLIYIEKKLKTTHTRNAIRLEVAKGIKGKLYAWLMDKLGISSDSVYEINGPIDLVRFFEFISLVSKPELIDEKIAPLEIPFLKENESIFEAIKQWSTIPLLHPFERFDYVIKMLNEAAEDPNVLAIKNTLYRVSGDSPVVQALQRAAENGKQVTVIVELKARFDESNNIEWAKRLEKSGAHVIYGMRGLKIHCKALLIVRRESGVIRRYLHLATGNYNDSTAKIYTDIGMFLNDPEICSDVAALFNVMTGYSEPPVWNKVAVAPFNLREKFISLIDREARNATRYNPGHIIAKMNSLVDKEIIEHLYKAAYAGVKIELIVRGICCLKPGINTKNINVISIVDRYLEHSRVYYFANNGNPEYYLSSADWMPRNLDKRIELLFPVENRFSQELIRKTLDLQLFDTYKGRKLNSYGNYPKVRIKNSSTRSQLKTYQVLRKLRPKQKKRISMIFEKKD